MSVRKLAFAMLVALVSLTSVANAQTFTRSPSYKFPHTDGARAYQKAHRQVAHHLGHRAAGRDIVRYGIRFKWVSKDHTQKHWGIRRATWDEVRGRTVKLRKLMQPAPLGARGSGFVIPGYIVQCESHGQNLPPNGAGASGYYQIIPTTWRGFGGLAYAPAAYLAPKWAQDRVAARIAAQAGLSQWDCA